MIDLYLRADSAEALANACPFLRGEDEEGKRFWITSGDGFSLDVIGAIVDQPGTYDPDTGLELSAPTFVSGFHANLRCTEDIAELVPEGVKVSPDQPARVWA